MGSGRGKRGERIFWTAALQTPAKQHKREGSATREEKRRAKTQEAKQHTTHAATCSCLSARMTYQFSLHCVLREIPNDCFHHWQGAVEWPRGSHTHTQKEVCSAFTTSLTLPTSRLTCEPAKGRRVQTTMTPETQRSSTQNRGEKRQQLERQTGAARSGEHATRVPPPVRDQIGAKIVLQRV